MGGRVGSRLAYLRPQARLPIRVIQEYVATLHRLHLSPGASVDRLHRLHRLHRLRAAPTAERDSPRAHLDETGWRVDGQNG